jgi:hypothetical protein
MAERCGRVDLWVHGHYTVKFESEKEPVKKALLGPRQCPDDAVVFVPWDGCVFQWCAAHAKDPTCGVPAEAVAAAMPPVEAPAELV